jgi:threonine/homoserine/homoserine lactone efflux protein
MSPFLQGLVIGFSIAAPVGPIGLLCIRRSLTDGRLAGFVSGLGAATADALYGLIAALGLTGITSRLVEVRVPLQVGGGLFLVYLGIAALRAPPQVASAPDSGATKSGGMFVSTFFLTLTNPMTILSFLGIFAGLNAGTGSVAAASLLVAGVFLGSAAWWFVLSAASGWFGSRLRQGGLRFVNIASGVIIAAFGGWQLLRLAIG